MTTDYGNIEDPKAQEDGWESFGGLDADHRQLLIDSAISPDVASSRGYRTETNRHTLRELGFSQAQSAGGGGLLLSIHTHDGNVAFQQLRPDTPRQDRRGNDRRYEMPPGRGNVIDVHPHIRQHVANPTADLWITEGVRKADSANSRGLCCIALLSVWGFASKGSYGDSEPLEDWQAIPLEGRTVYIAYDSDVATKPQVGTALRNLTKLLRGRGATVKIVYLPHQADGSKQGLDDFFAAGGTVEGLYPLASDELRGARHRLRMTANVAEMVTEAWEAMASHNDDTSLVHFGSQPCRVTPTARGANLQPIDRDMLRLEVSQRIETFKQREDGDEPRNVIPPDYLLTSMLKARQQPLPELQRVVTVPVFAPDGSLQDALGYSVKTQTYYAPAQGFALPAIPEQPTPAQRDEAKRLILDELLGQFPFVAEADCAHAVALGILPFVRDLIDGPTPAHLVESPTPGTGKDKLVRKSTFAALGDEPTLMPEVKDDDEWRKQITTTLMASPAVVLLSNVNHKLDSGALASALSTKQWNARLLGSNKDVSVPVRTVWAITGNNMLMSPEITRRGIRIRLDAELERPWLRADFRHDLERWTTTHRAELAAAYLTLVRHWFAQGQPKGTTKLGNYEEWSAIIGGILGTAEIPGFLGNLDDFYEAADSESDGWRAFTTLWWMVHQDSPATIKELHELLDGVEGIEAETTRSLGRQLSKHRDMTIGKYRIKPSTLLHGASRWKLTRTEPESEFETKQREADLKDWKTKRAQANSFFAGKTQ